MTTLSKTLMDLQENLGKQQTKEAAWDVIQEYFSFFDISSIQDELWALTVGTLTNDEMKQSEKGRDRHDLIFFFEYTKLFFEAAWVLNERTKEGGRL